MAPNNTDERPMLSDRRKEKNSSGLGQRLKDARVAEGLTQKALADALGLDYYTMISQMELGYMSIPPSLWTPIADALKMDRSEWVLRCLGEYQPDVYRALFGSNSRSSVSEVLTLFLRGELGGIIKK